MTSGLSGRRLTTRTALTILCTAIASSAPAQTVSDALTFLMTNQSVSTGDFERDRTAAQTTSDTVSRALLANLATLPVATSSTGFLYRLNPELGTMERATQNFGPFFVERALTAGRHQASVGLTLQELRFTSLDGRNLRDGSLVTTANQFVDESAAFDVDRLALDINAHIATLYANVGVTDRMEVGVAVPMVDLTLDGTRMDTYRGRTFTQAHATARAIGVADIVARTKITVYKDAGAGVATAAEVRVPSGREQDLLGAGQMSFKFSGIGSLESGRMSTHAVAGITVGGLARELSYGGAFAVAATPRVTMTAEVLGRWIDGAGHIVEVSAPHPTLQQVVTTRLVGDASGLHLMTFVPGFKWNVTETWVLAANVALPLTSGGLTARVTPFVGLDYALGR
jgi:hypothetical protein